MANQSFSPTGGAAPPGGATAAFKTLSSAGQDNIVADTSTDTLFLSAMGNFAVEHHPLTDTLILSGGPGGAGGVTVWVDDGSVVRLNNISDKVGIGTVDPGCELTVAGCISAQGIVYDSISSSTQWLQVHSTVQAESGGWAGAAAAGGWTDDGVIVRLSTGTDKVGIGTTAPSEKLTIAGHISASGSVTVSGGDSDQWSSTFSTVKSNSANWDNTYSQVFSTSADWSEYRFKTISTSGQTDIVADTVTDTLTLSAMGDLEIHHHDGTDTIILSAGPGEVNEFSFKTISTTGQTDIVADTVTDTLTLSAMGSLEVHHHPLTDTIIVSGGPGGGAGGAHRTDFEIAMVSEVFR